MADDDRRRASGVNVDDLVDANRDALSRSRAELGQVRVRDLQQGRREDVDHARRGAGQITPSRHPNTLQRFTRRFGWRAYALPLLLAITVLALIDVTSGGSGHSGHPTGAPAVSPGNGVGHSGGVASDAPVSPPVASGNTSLQSDQAGSNALNQVLASGALPQGGDYTKKGTGAFHVIPGTSKPVGAGQLYTYAVDVEDGISGIDATQFADEVQSVLSAKQSWAGHGDVTLQRVDTGEASFRVSLTSVETDHKYCGYSIPVETSCYVTQGDNGADTNRVVLSVARWVRGSMAYIGDLDTYRIYMINHETGHAISHEHAHQCLPGGEAPVMMQQTIGLKSAVTGQMCTANPWPYPDGVAGAPGAEQPDTDANSEYILTGD
ncbi:MAG TPA: DUF3152 domain-containing protein [Jatrophihabitans sp.]